MAEAKQRDGEEKVKEELGELDQFMEHHLDEEQDEVRLRFRGSTDNLSPTLRLGKSDVYRSERTALAGTADGQT